MLDKLKNLISGFNDKEYLETELIKMIDEEDYNSDEYIQKFVTQSVVTATRRANFSHSFNKPNKEFLVKLLKLVRESI